MLSLLFYLQGSVAKKPYNPIIGETFHCSWRLSPEEIQNCKPMQKIVQATTSKPESQADDKVHGTGDKPSRGEKTADGDKQKETSRVSGSSGSGPVQLTYCAEQVSHHPPSKITVLFVQLKAHFHYALVIFRARNYHDSLHGMCHQSSYKLIKLLRVQVGPGSGVTRKLNLIPQHFC